MLYQLSNGKVIQLTLDQYLDLDDEDIQYLIATNAGDYVRNPFHASATKTKKKKKKEEQEEEEDIDTRIDYTDEDEGLTRRGGIVDDLPPEELPEVPDQGIDPD